MKTVQGH